jgi:5,10-methylenetetrahydromethanopterin reductase
VAEVKIGGSANPDVIPHFRRVIDAAASLVGRAGADIGIVVGAVCVVDEDGAAARALARREVALYLPVVAGLDPTVTPAQWRIRQGSSLPPVRRGLNLARPTASRRRAVYSYWEKPFCRVCEMRG